jgi:hypothetical protein
MRYCVSCGTGPGRPVQEGSSTATHLAAQSPPLWSGGLRCRPVREGSGTATCLAALDPTSLFEKAPVLSRVPQLSDGTNKKVFLNSKAHTLAREACVYQGTCKMCILTTTVLCCSAVPRGRPHASGASRSYDPTGQG